MKKVLIVCTGNSCRSIMAEALINSYLKGVKAFSCGTNIKEDIAPITQVILEERGISDESIYYPKSCEEFRDEELILVVTGLVDFLAKRRECPLFSQIALKNGGLSILRLLLTPRLGTRLFREVSSTSSCSR